MLIYFLFTYIAFGVMFSLYILGSHCRACFEYIRQLYTAKEVRPKDIKTYFGTRYWDWNNNDDWTEVIFMSSLPALFFTLVSLIGWPLGIIFILNNSIQRARERIENDL